MSTLTAHASSTTTAAFPRRDAADIEPDETWKAGLRKRIEDGLNSMVKDAKDSLENQLRQKSVSAVDRERFKSEYTQAMSTIRRLAGEQYQDELDRERQERRWASGIPMHPQWNDALVQEQVEIMERIKRSGGQDGGSTASPNNSPTEERRPTVVPPPRPAPPLPAQPTYEVPPLPPQLKEMRNQAASASMGNSRRGSDYSTSSRDREETVASIRRTAARPTGPDRPSLPENWRQAPTLVDEPEEEKGNDADDEEALLRPPVRSKPAVEMAPIPEVPVSRSIDRSSRSGSISERHTTHSPPKTIPAIWKPSISPEEDAAASKPFVAVGVINRRGSTASIRSTGSGSGRRPSIAETIPERPDNAPGVSANLARERERLQEAEKPWNHIDKAREKQPMRTDNRPRTFSEEISHFDEQRQAIRTDHRQRTFSEEIPHFDTYDVPPPPRSAGQPPMPPRAVVPKSSFTNDEQHRYPDRRPPPKPGFSIEDDMQNELPPSTSSTTSRSVSRKPSFANEDRDRDRGTSAVHSTLFPASRSKPPFNPEDREYQAGSPQHAPGSHRVTQKVSFSVDERENGYSEFQRQYGTLSSTRPPNSNSNNYYPSTPVSAGPRPGKDYPSQEEFDERTDSRSFREHGPRLPDTSEGQGDYQRSGSTRPQPSRQSSYSRREREEFDRRQGAKSDDVYNRQPFSASPSIPIGVPRHSPGLEEPGIGSWRERQIQHLEEQEDHGMSSWRDWSTQERRPSDSRYDHPMRQRGWPQEGPAPIRSPPSSYQSGRHDAPGYHNFGGRDGWEYQDDIEEYDSDLEREKEEAERMEMEARMKEDEARLKEEEARRKLEESIKKKETEAKKKEIEARKKEAEARMKEAEARIKAEEVKRMEEEAKAKEEEVKKMEEDAKRMEEEARKMEEQARKRTAEAKRREAEIKKKEEELKRREAELAQREREAKRKELEDARRKEAEEEEWKQEEEERNQAEEERKQAEEERKQAEAERREELKRKREEKKKEEDDRKREEQRKVEEECRVREERNSEWAKMEQDKLRLDRERQAKEQEKSRKEQQEKQRQEQERVYAEQERQRKAQDFPLQDDRVRMQQQEDFRKREEEIRRRADERKRQDSAESAWHTATSPISSSPSASSKPPQRTGSANASADRSSTSSTSTWSSASSGWSSSSKATSASNSSASSGSRTTTSTPTTKPRAGSTSSNTYPSGASPSASASFKEAEWARRHAEQAQKQQEQFRREQERLEADRVARSAGKVLTKDELVQLFEMHERLWSNLATREILWWGDFPWPMVKKPLAPEDITMAAISAYIQSPHYPEKDKSRTAKDRLKDHIRRWHPDRFETKLLLKVAEPDKVKVKEGAGSVVRSLNELLTRSNAPTSMFS